MASTEDELAPLLEALEVEVPDFFDGSIPPEHLLSMMDDEEKADIKASTDIHGSHFPGNSWRYVEFPLDGQTVTALEVTLPDGEKHYSINDEMIEAPDEKDIKGFKHLYEQPVKAPELGHQLPGIDR